MTVVATPVYVRASIDEAGLSLTSREALRRCPCSELPDDLRDVPVRVDRVAECVLVAELVRFELMEWWEALLRRLYGGLEGGIPAGLS